MPAYDAFEPNRVKHLEMIQAVVARLGNDSFLVKGWTVTVSGAFIGFGVTRDDWALAGLSIVPTLLFWALDTYFLRAERLFRVLYDHVRDPTYGVEPFFMGATTAAFAKQLAESERCVASWSDAFLRPTMWRFYGALFVAGVVAMLAVCAG